MSHPSITSDIVTSYCTPSLPHLTETEAISLSNGPLRSGQIFPADRSLFTRNLSLLDHYTFVAPSELVPGELGLFARLPLYTGRHRLFLGLYTGIIYSKPTPSSMSLPHISPHTAEAYSLHLHSQWYILGHMPHLGTRAQRLCVLAHANEWIWRPDDNPLQFGTHGCVYLKPHQHIAANTELTIFYGESYGGWDSYKRALLRDLQSYLRSQLLSQGQTYWYALLETSFAMLRTHDLAHFREHSPCPTLAHLLLALVEYYGPPLLSETPPITSLSPLIPWLQQLVYCTSFTRRFTFRKAHNPHHQTVPLPIGPPPPPPLSDRPRRACTQHSQPMVLDPHQVDELVHDAPPVLLDDVVLVPEIHDPILPTMFPIYASSTTLTSQSTRLSIPFSLTPFRPLNPLPPPSLSPPSPSHAAPPHRSPPSPPRPAHSSRPVPSSHTRPPHADLLALLTDPQQPPLLELARASAHQKTSTITAHSLHSVPDLNSPSLQDRPLSQLPSLPTVQAYTGPPDDPPLHHDSLLEDHLSPLPPPLPLPDPQDPPPQKRARPLPTSSSTSPNVQAPICPPRHSLSCQDPTLADSIPPLIRPLPLHASPTHMWTAPSPTPPNSLIVLLGMSHERLSDITRILRLLQHHQFVIGVARAPIPTARELRALLPFFQAGRYIYISQDFSHLDRSTSRSPNQLLDTLSTFNTVPTRIVCLDYYSCVTYNTYGHNWLHRSGPRLTHSPAHYEGNCAQLLRFATEVYLPNDNRGDLLRMVDRYRLSISHPSMHLRLTHSSPLATNDIPLGPIDGRPSAPSQIAQYLATPPFLRVTSLPNMSVPPGPQATPRSDVD